MSIQSHCPILSADYHLCVSVSSLSVLLKAQRTHMHCSQTHHSSALFFRYLATSYFFSFPGSFSGPHRLLFLSTLPWSPLPVFAPPALSFQSHSSRPSRCILDERHSSFFFALFLTYSRLTVLLQRHSFVPNKEIIYIVQKSAFRERCFAGDLLWSLLLNLFGLSFGQHMVPSKALTQHVCTYVSAKTLDLDVLMR